MYTISDVTSFGKGQLGINLVVLSSCDNKLTAAGQRIYAGRLQKATLVTNVRVGCEYSNFVNAKSDSNNFVGGGMPDSDISPLNMRSLFGIVGVFVACIHYKESLFLRHKSHTER